VFNERAKQANGLVEISDFFFVEASAFFLRKDKREEAFGERFLWFGLFVKRRVFLGE